jgi:hypothetical protein
MAPSALELNFNSLTALVLALQFAAFGWRINREIPVGDSGRKTWFPLPDILNVVSMFAVVWFCVVSPIVDGQFNKSSRVALAVAFVLIAFHPVSMVGHYRLFTKHGRHVYTERGEDFPYYTATEIASVVLAIALAVAVGVWGWCRL